MNQLKIDRAIKIAEAMGFGFTGVYFTKNGLSIDVGQFIEDMEQYDLEKLVDGHVDFLVEQVYKNACDKGFHPPEVTREQFISDATNNLHDEVSELHESFRNHNFDKPCDKSEKMVKLGIEPLTCAEEELADIFIRTLDDARHLGINMLSAVQRKMKYNSTREFRHGGKKC